MKLALVGMETSGKIRRRLYERGWTVISCDLLPPDDEVEAFTLLRFMGLRRTRPRICHITGDVFELLDYLWSIGMWPTVAVFHPDCTYLTGSAEWAYSEPDFVRYPGVGGGYHQRVKAETLTGHARREAREKAIGEFRKLVALPIRLKIFENPVGKLSTVVAKPNIIVQPYECGDDASKKTCLWAFGKDHQVSEDIFILDPEKFVPPTLRANGKSYWANQTDNGQNRLSPGADRWKDRSETYDGIADFVVDGIERYFGI